VDEDGKRSRAGSAFARARDKLRAAGVGSADRLRRTTNRVAGALGSAAERIRETPAAEKLGAALETRRVVKRAAEARQRGNLPMAYRLLEAELRERPGDPRVVAALWDTALASGRQAEVVDSVLPVIRGLAASEGAEAARLWVEVVTALPDVRADAGSLVRLVPVLLEGDDMQWPVLALRHALDPGASGLTPGLAVRVAEYARVLDPPTALRAARIALAAPDLHESRRDALRQLVFELERDGAVEPDPDERAPTGGAIAEPPLTPSSPPPAAATATAPAVADELDDVFSALVIEPALELHAPALRFQSVKAMAAIPTALGSDALELRVGADRRGRVELAKIQAIAVAEIGDRGAEDVLIDLALNWRDEGDGILRVVRLRSGDFDAGAVVGGVPESGSGVRVLLTRLFERTEAVPLPDLDAALGDPLRVFDSIADYEREVLQAGSADEGSHS
jgi:hypothetical protein